MLRFSIPGLLLVDHFGVKLFSVALNRFEVLNSSLSRQPTVSSAQIFYYKREMDLKLDKLTKRKIK